jgi:hypothetical protein
LGSAFNDLVPGQVRERKDGNPMKASRVLADAAITLAITLVVSVLVT